MFDSLSQILTTKKKNFIIVRILSKFMKTKIIYWSFVSYLSSRQKFVIIICLLLAFNTFQTGDPHSRLLAFNCCGRQTLIPSFVFQRCGWGTLFWVVGDTIQATQIYKFFKKQGNFFLTYHIKKRHQRYFHFIFILISNKIIHLLNAIRSLELFQSYIK